LSWSRFEKEAKERGEKKEDERAEKCCGGCVV